MKHLFGLIVLLFVQKLNDFDRWLCVKAPWYVRLPWCSLWVRSDEFHPSLEYDYDALNRRAQFYRKLLCAWFNVTRLRPVPSKRESDEEAQKIFEILRDLRAKYFISIAERKIMATLSTQKPHSLT